METKNTYLFPVKIDKKVKISYSESPAHVGALINAVDFIVSVGTLIIAPCDGTVVDVKCDSDVGGLDKSFDALGNYIEIKHKNEEYSIYEHIKQNGSLVKVGDEVKAGQIIGYSGATGWLAHLGPHLHFDVHKYFGSESNDYKTLKIKWAK